MSAEGYPGPFEVILGTSHREFPDNSFSDIPAALSAERPYRHLPQKPQKQRVWGLGPWAVPEMCCHCYLTFGIDIVMSSRCNLYKIASLQTSRLLELGYGRAISKIRVQKVEINRRISRCAVHSRTCSCR